MDKRIGILVYRGDKGYGNPAFLRRLVEEGTSMGVEVFVFSPQDVDRIFHQIRGYEPYGAGWKWRWREWPDIVIDYYRYYPLAKHRHYLPVREGSIFRFANNRFANKFRVHQILEQEPEVYQWLPETVPFSKKNLSDMIKKHPRLYLKPSNGTAGRSILRIERKGDRFLLCGRTKKQGQKNEILPNTASLTQRIKQWVEQEKRGDEHFFLQQGLDLGLLSDRTVDARLLIQKDGQGVWRTTGMGMRVGPAHSSTSNLHGGGTALPAGQFLSSRFGVDLAEIIIHQCQELALVTAEKLESHFGQMMEFGFDLGIDTEGRVWIIEINPKPGRDIFRKLGQLSRYRQAVRRPLEYALHLLEKDSLVSQ